MCDRKRARRDEDKEAKGEAILDEAERLWLERGFEAITVQLLADRLGYAKGTLYLYFGTKEEVFLALHRRCLERWAPLAEEALRSAAAVAGGEPAARAVASALCDSLRSVPALLGLSAVLGSLLERNVGLEALLAYKRWLASMTARLAAALGRALPGLGEDASLEALTMVQALAAGLFPLAEPGRIARLALAEPGLERLRLDFTRSFTSCLEAYLEGRLALDARKG